MKFEEALELLKQGKNVIRKDWLSFIYFGEVEGKTTDTEADARDQVLIFSHYHTPYNPSLDDMMADDWEEFFECGPNVKEEEFVIDCEKIVLKNNGIEIAIQKDLGSCRLITINGIKFTKEE